jgi:hypothetical protein
MVPVRDALGIPFEDCGKVLSDLIRLVDFLKELFREIIQCVYIHRSIPHLDNLLNVHSGEVVSLITVNNRAQVWLTPFRFK